MRDWITFLLDGKLVDLRFGRSTGLTPTTTVLNYLRSLPGHRGVKEGCAEGDCGACTVVIGELGKDRKIRYRAVDSCLLFLPMLHGKLLVTVENLRSSDGVLHPVQQAMVDSHGSQCGFCTPGIIMSLFALTKNVARPTVEDAKVALAGNLCRCTGYRPIIEAGVQAAGTTARHRSEVEEPSTVKLLKSIPNQSIVTVTDEQRYDQPTTLKECLALVKKYPEAVVVNGGTDIALRVTKKFEILRHVIDFSRVAELARVGKTKTALSVGAGVKVSDLLHHARRDFPALCDILNVFGAEQIRNVATIGGNIATASPIGDILPALIAYDAKIVMQSAKSVRTVRADQFVTGYRKTERKRDEIITKVILPIPRKTLTVRTYKVSKRRDLDIATVSAGFSMERDAKGTVKRVTLAYGGMAERTKRAELTEKFLTGRPWTRSVVEEARALLDKDFTPIADVRGSAEFRKIVAGNLLLKFWSDTKQ
jgi:xanthine dehydrogenase small subunit